MKNNLKIDLFKELMLIPSPTGYTNNVVKFLDNYVKGLGYETSRNKKGNLIVHHYIENTTTWITLTSCTPS